MTNRVMEITVKIEHIMITVHGDAVIKSNLEKVLRLTLFIHVIVFAEFPSGLSELCVFHENGTRYGVV